MSDDLVKRLRSEQPVTQDMQHTMIGSLMDQAADRIKELEAELHLMKTAGIVEVSVRNPSVIEYMKHWEGRAEAAEAKLAKAQAWQPIETAPQDATQILLAIEVRGSPAHPTKPMQHIRWEYEIGTVFEGEIYVENPEAGWIGNDYSHWMPLPKPPQETDK